MRSRLRAAMIVRVLFLAGGASLSARAPDLVRTETLRRLGERWHWSGTYVETTRGRVIPPGRGYCPEFEFSPNYADWEAGVKIWGFIAGLTGVGIFGLAWRIRSVAIAARAAGREAAGRSPR